MASGGNRFLLVVTAVMLSGLLVSNVFAGTLTVTTLDDYGPGSLRQAIADAAQGDTVSITVNGTITTQSALTINKSLTIEGPGAANLTISRDQYAGYYSVVYIDPGANVTLRGLTITQGTGTEVNGTFYGGGVYVGAGATLSVTNSAISGNGTPAYGLGGGIYGEGTILVTDSIISGNRAGINGSNGTGAGIFNSGSTSLINSTISGNWADTRYGTAGGVYSNGTLTVTNSTISRNHGGGMYGQAGGIYSYGTLTITDSTISDNEACIGGGGIQSNGTVTISGSTISGNNNHHGTGGINNYGTLTITNSTFSGNSSNSSWSSASIFNYDSNGTSKIDFTTVSGLAGWVISTDVMVYGTDVANSVILGSCQSDRNSVNSLVSDGSCGATYSGDPLFGPLADNGGPTRTHALLSGSPVIDLGGICTGTDQRGVARPQGAGCDLGAYEALFYKFGGFLAPVSLAKPFKLGSTVPVKFQLEDAGGAAVTSATARFYLQQYSNSEPVGDPVEVTSSSEADIGNYFRVADGAYLYNLNTRDLSVGRYQIQVVLDDDSTNAIWLDLKQ